MKKAKPLIGFIMVLLLAVSIVQAQSYIYSIDLILTQQNPNPVEPGQTLSIEITIENEGYNNAQNMVIELVPKSPFSLIQGETAVRTFSSIPAAGIIKTNYRLYIDNNALSNNYELEFRMYSSGTPDNYIKKNIMVSVQGSSELIVDSVTTVPEDLEPGGLATLLFKVKNLGTGAVRSAKATLTSDSDEIIPVYSAGKVYVGDIGPNETGQISIQVSIDQSAEYKTYITMLTLNYYDENNQQQSTEFSVGIPVTGSINLDIIKMEPNYNRNQLQIEVANKGTTDARSVEARLYIDGEMVDVDYISSLKSTKKTTFDFPLVFQRQGELVIDYIGPGLDKNQETFDLVFDFLPQGSGGATELVLLLLVVLAIVDWRKKWHRKLPFFRKKK